MSISISIPKTLHGIIRKLFGRLAGRQIAWLDLSADATGLRIVAVGPESCLECFQPGSWPDFQSAIPFALLAELRSNKDTQVELSHPRAGILSARWQEREMPRSLEYELLSDREPPPIPSLPTSWSDNSAEILTALREAFFTTDDASSRYALRCVQFKGKIGEIIATDGRQALVQSGFNFPFQDELLIPRTQVFDYTALSGDGLVQIGLAAEKLVVRSGPWTIWLPISTEGRFPKIDQAIPPPDSATTTLQLSDVDIRFLRENLRRLPGTSEERQVTLDLNGSVALRAKATNTPQPTELSLNGAIKSGADLRLCFDRQFLARVVELNLSQLYFYGADASVLATGEGRKYVWMPMQSSGALPPDPSALRMDSPAASTVRSTPRSPNHDSNQNRPTTSTVSTMAEVRPPQSKSTSTKNARRDATSAHPSSALEQASQIQNSLRSQLQSVKQLLRQLRSEKKQQRLLKNTLASLRQLQPAA